MPIAIRNGGNCRTLVQSTDWLAVILVDGNIHIIDRGSHSKECFLRGVIHLAISLLRMSAIDIALAGMLEK
ncbi:hypothetical protein OKW40_004365 [Paraburkholderia sp. RAU6.4a]|uniref:hypothetical protein n=1 Tax=Paraburkholderia sp. RAU6.4a TaxID=2991067 RepID=UPI003D19D5C1